MRPNPHADLQEAELAALFGHPGACTRWVRAVLGERPVARGDGYPIGRWGFVHDDPEVRAIWWVWPWALDELAALLAEPRVPSSIRAELDWLQRSGDAGPARVELATPRSVAAGSPDLDWVTAALRTRTGQPSLTVSAHGPAEIRRWWAAHGRAPVPEPIVCARAFAARELALSSCERELVAALDAEADGGGPVPAELWAVVADELQRRGDPTGESLALALARAEADDQPSRARSLDQAYREREAARVARAPSQFQRLAYVDARGLSFDVRELEPGGLGAAPMLDGFVVRLWAARVGPFFVRTLAQSDDPALAGLGLPAALLDAPELRYLSARRHASLAREGGDVSLRDLSGFRLTPLARAEGLVYADRTRLRGADLRGADLSHWRIERADLRDAVGDLDTRLAGSSFVDAVVSAPLHRLIVAWNERRGVERIHDHTGLRVE